MAPTERETAIEVPWWLMLSPHKDSGWAHAREPVHHGTPRTELWHTRLGARRQVRDGDFLADEKSDDERAVRAVWARDAAFADSLETNSPPSDGATPFLMSLSPLDRHDIVRLSADWDIPGYHPQAVPVTRLMLSSLGAWLDAQGDWNPPAAQPPGQFASNLLQWRHRAAMGRDAYVRVVRRGYLFPWGHPAVLVKITERKFARANDTGPRGAYLRQRLFTVVLRPDKDFTGAVGQPHGGRRFPFRHLRITTLVTPPLDDKQEFAPGLGNQEKIFPLRVSNSPFRFHFVARDWADALVEFDAPALFVSDGMAYDANKISPFIGAYNALADDTVRKSSFHGQLVSVAKSLVPDDTALELEAMTFGADIGATPGGQFPDIVSTDSALRAAGQPRYYPTMTEAATRLAAAEQISGQPDLDTVVEYHPDYLVHEFSNGPAQNPGQVFARVKGTGPSVGFAADKSGGLVTPDISVSGLSRLLGVVAGNVETVKAGTFDPKAFFPATAKLLGGVKLIDVIQSAGILDTAPKEAMTLTSRRLPGRIETRLEWHPIVQPDPLRIFVPSVDARLDLRAVTVTDLINPAQSTFSIEGELRDFKLNLLGENANTTQFLIITFARLRFSVRKGQKPDINVDIAETKFAGVLHFVETLSKYCSFGAGGPSIELLGDRIAAGITVNLPSLKVGVFSLQNIAATVGLTIPLDGQPVRVRFAFCERANPFLLTVLIFGGGGFFGLEVGADGVELLEAALEFAAACSVDVGVASGGVELVAGVYFKIETVKIEGKDQENCTLTGYVRLGGELEVLGIVSLSLEFYMGLTYQSNPEKVVGEASMTVEIEVLVFSAAVTITVRRSFGNNSGDPTFGDQLEPSDWDAYCAAFAPIGA